MDASVSMAASSAASARSSNNVGGINFGNTFAPLPTNYTNMMIIAGIIIVVVIYLFKKS